MNNLKKLGWVRLYRKSLFSSVAKNPIIWWVWCWCLMKANHQNNKFPFNNQDIIIKRGQFITGINKASLELKISPQKYKTAINYLKSTSRITIKSTNKFSLITIEKWQEYQDDNNQNNNQNNKQLTNKQQTTNKQLTTNNNDKNDKNDKNIGLAKNQPSRNSFKFSKNDYNEIIKLYEQLTGIKHRNNEYLPLQQTIKTMFLNGRTKKEIIDCMQFINNKPEECWKQWNIQTINKQLPRFLSGKF